MFPQDVDVKRLMGIFTVKLTPVFLARVVHSDELKRFLSGRWQIGSGDLTSVNRR